MLDFYCAEARLALELDGAQHQHPDRLRYDQIRSEQLALARIRVLRFENREVLHNIDRICDQIRAILGSLSHDVGEGRGEGARHDVGEGRGEGAPPRPANQPK